MKRRILIAMMMMPWIMTGCDGISISDADVQNAPQATTIMVTAPYENQHFSVGEMVEIKTEVYGAVSAPTISLFVNDAVYRSDTFTNRFDQANFYQTWTARVPGTYLLQTKIGDSAGSDIISNQVIVIVDEVPLPEPEKLEDVIQPKVEEEECQIPMATSTGYPFCRSGPGTGYNEITNLKPGQSLPIVAVSGSGSWWQIEYNASADTCWVWDDLIEKCGNLIDIPVVFATEKEAIEEVPEQKEPDEDNLPAYTACHDYPDLSSCNTDSKGFGGCSWNTGTNQCEP